MNEKKIMKPSTLLKEEFSRDLINLCNNSELPFFILEYVLKDVYLEVKSLAQKQYELDLAKYYSDLEKCEGSKNDE